MTPQESLPLLPSTLNVLFKGLLVFCLSSNISSFYLHAIDPVSLQSGERPLCGPLLQGEVGLAGAPCTQGTYCSSGTHCTYNFISRVNLEQQSHFRATYVAIIRCEAECVDLKVFVNRRVQSHFAVHLECT